MENRAPSPALVTSVASATLPMAVVTAFGFGMRIEGKLGLGVYCILMALCVAATRLRWVRTNVNAYVDFNSFSFGVSAFSSLVLLPLFQLGTPYSIYVETAVFVLATTLLALSLTMWLAGLIDLGLAAYVGLGAYVSARLSMDLGCPLPLALLGATLAGAAVAKLLSFPLLIVRGHYFSLATLALGLFSYHVFVQSRSLTNGIDGIGNIPGFAVRGSNQVGHVQIGPVSFPYQIEPYYWTLFCFFIVFLFIRSLSKGQFARCLQATRDNEPSAVSSGISVRRYRSWAYTISGAVAGFSGAMYAHTVNYIAPGDFDLQRSVFFVMLAVLGGLGKPLPLVVSASIMVFLEEKFREFGDLRLLLVALAILVVVLSRGYSSVDRSSSSSGCAT